MAPAFTTGQLLVASPGLCDGVFDQAVVLVLDHDADGALGVVLNRPGDLTVDEVVESLGPIVSEPRVVFDGGPVGRNGFICVARAQPGVRLEGFLPMVGTLGLLDLDHHLPSPDTGVEVVRLFAGYAGWSPGQLEGELSVDAWFVLDAAPDDVFCLEPARLWQDVLRRQGGSLARVARYPSDVRVN